jgi:gliding motility-associated-like protein
MEIPGLALYPNAVVMVFDRRGQKVFETKNYTSNPWNGFYKGTMQPDVYVYMIQLNDDKKQFFKGTVTLIR